MSLITAFLSPELDALDQSRESSPDSLLRQEFCQHKISTDESTLMSSYDQPNPPTLSPSPVSSHNFLSPTVDYLSDQFFSEVSEHTSPNMEDNMFANNPLGVMSGFGTDGVVLPDSNYNPQTTASAAFPSTSRPIYPRRQSSLGVSDAPSHILTPDMSDTRSVASREGNARFDNIGANCTRSRPRTTTNSPASVNLASPSRGFASTKGTPSLIHSPGQDSLRAASKPPALSGVSPIVRVEAWSRGDSPSRSSFHKQSGRPLATSSHLSLAEDESLEYDSDSGPNGSSGKDRQRFDATATLSCRDNFQSLGYSAQHGGLGPEARKQLQGMVVPNFKDQELQRKLQETNAHVQEWLVHSEAGSEIDWHPHRHKGLKPRHYGRSRAKTVGDRPNTGNSTGIKREPQFDDRGIPGPGVLVTDDIADEESETSSTNTSEDSLQSPPAAIHPSRTTEESYFPQVPPQMDKETATWPWQDPPYQPQNEQTPCQPPTTNAAIQRFRQQADNISYVSRAATIGSNGRRMSETDLSKLTSSAGILRKLAIRKDKDSSRPKGERRGSILHHVGQKLIPKRSISNLKTTDESGPKEPQSSPGTNSDAAQRSRESPSSIRPQNRKPSFVRRAKSPSVDISSAVAVMAGSMAAVGAGTPLSATNKSLSPNSAWPNAIAGIKRPRSSRTLSDGQPGLTDLLRQAGGPPMPTLAAPSRNTSISAPSARQEESHSKTEGQEQQQPVKMSLKPRSESITPTLQGFRTHIQNLNPRLEPFLVNRLAQEQVKRYKRLMQYKIRHYRETCAVKKEGMADPTRTTHSPIANTLSSCADITRDGDYQNGASEGLIKPEDFSPGIPMPPVERLPAEFECYLCFRKKKFKKPSDWTKHVQEDVEPFTCTFPCCPEPKSFKRKADWVRHEMERHRHLEWWACSKPDCSHKCYRKDNFVQHLVREHKMPEPKVKLNKDAQRADATAPFQSDADQVMALVDSCRQESNMEAREEPCKFCANILQNWKQLTVHLAKHMEQIAMPILGVVEATPISANMILSPVEDSSLAGSPLSPMNHANMNNAIYPSFPTSNGQTGLGVALPNVGWSSERLTSSPTTQTGEGSGSSNLINVRLPDRSVNGMFSSTYEAKDTSSAYSYDATTHYPRQRDGSTNDSGYVTYNGVSNNLCQQSGIHVPTVPSQGDPLTEETMYLPYSQDFRLMPSYQQESNNHVYQVSLPFDASGTDYNFMDEVSFSSGQPGSDFVYSQHSDFAQ